MTPLVSYEAHGTIQRQRCTVCGRRNRTQVQVGHLNLCSEDKRWGSCWLRWLEERVNEEWAAGTFIRRSNRRF